MRSALAAVLDRAVQIQQPDDAAEQDYGGSEPYTEFSFAGRIGDGVALREEPDAAQTLHERTVE